MVGGWVGWDANNPNTSFLYQLLRTFIISHYYFVAMTLKKHDSQTCCACLRPAPFLTVSAGLDTRRCAGLGYAWLLRFCALRLWFEVSDGVSGEDEEVHE